MTRIPLAVPNVGPNEALNLQACIDDNFVSSVGRFVDKFEEDVGTLSGVGKGVATGAGTQALHMALVVLGVVPGDLVICPSFTFIASANSISHAGATPWLMDISRDDWTMNPAVVERELAAYTNMQDGVCIHTPTGRPVRAMMPVYTLGMPADMRRLRAIASQYSIKIVADAAAAIGVDFEGKPIGDLADLTCYSFNGNKTITCGGGGMIVGPDPDLIAKAKHLTTTARVPPNYDHDAVGYNYRMTNLQAAVGCAQFERLQEFLDAKRRIRKNYEAAFAVSNVVDGFPSHPDRTSACWFSGVVFRSDDVNAASDLCKALGAQQIEARIFWKPVHLQPPYAYAPRSEMAISEDLWQRIVTLPCSTSLSGEDQTLVIDAVNAHINGA